MARWLVLIGVASGPQLCYRQAMSSIPSPLIDVLSADSFAEEHVPGAVNFCVYETAFIEKIRGAFPDRAAALTLYGLSDATREAEIALSKLAAAGYSNVVSLPGGLERWKSEGGTAEQGPPRRIAQGRQELLVEESFIHWTGRNLFNFHTGSLHLSGGHLEFSAGRLTDADIEVDMTSLGCSDLTDSKLKQMLIEHLRSDDFFSIEQYPTAKFHLTSVTPIEGATLGLPNYRFAGEFTLRGISRSIEFEAVVGEKPDGGFVAQALLSIDRTLWNSIYGSGKFFARLGQHVVNDLIHLQLKITTLPATK